MNLTDEEFDQIGDEIQEVLKKHGVEIIIRSELTFKKQEETKPIEEEVK